MGKVRIIPAHQQRGNSINRSPDEPQSERLRVAAYCRVSTELDEQANSYETQVSHYKELIQKDPSWEFAGIFADDGISGTNTKKRDQFNKMIRACKAGKIDLIVTKSISRFARNTIDCLKYIRDLKAINQLIESHELAGKQIKANIMKIVKNSKGPTIEELDKRLEEAQLKLIQAANQHQNCNDLTQQVMELREQKEKVQEIESENQVKLHNIDQVSDFVDENQGGIQEFDPQLVRRLIEKITIFQRYIEFKFKDGEVIKVKI